MALPQTFITVTRRPPDVEDYIDMLRRYRSWIIGPMFAGLVISTVIAFLWKDTFQSTAEMRISPQQLTEMEQQILSRTTLEALITSPSLNLYPRERIPGGRPMDDIVEDMRLKD